MTGSRRDDAGITLPPGGRPSLASPPIPGRRLADRLLDAGSTVAQQWAERDAFDPSTPSLGVLVANTLAGHERIGEERILRRVRDLIEQRTALVEERLVVVAARIREGNLPAASSELRWATDLAEQIGALRLLLAPPAEPVTDPS